MRNFGLQCIAIVIFSIALVAQNTGNETNMPGMSGMTGMDGMIVKPASLIDALEQHTASGTDVQPASPPSEMLMRQFGSWSFMFHGEAFLNEIQESGPRGKDKLFSTNWFMPMAQKKVGKGLVTLRTMLSLEPATISNRRYPELFQQGETAYGKPLIDGQHPHDFIMELAAIYDFNFTEHAALSFYVAPVGDPAIGPPAYPHRSSASENPLAPLGHHLQDSTHIADEVVTGGFTYRNFRLEASGFHGREPDEYRWDIDSGRIDSWAARATLNPAKDWSLQYSIATLTSPEALDSNQDVRRMTASIIYSRALHRGNWSSLALWGRNQVLQNANVGNSYLFESTVRFLDRNYAWIRLENVDRTTELLGGSSLALTDLYFARVQAYTAGYDREFFKFSHISTALGGQFMWYGVPPSLRSDYGAHPVEGLLFLRFRVR